jgi:hypothetical protein
VTAAASAAADTFKKTTKGLFGFMGGGSGTKRNAVKDEH